MSNKWISVKDELPEPYESVLLSAIHPMVSDHVGWMNADGTFRSAFVRDLKYVTHWAAYTPGPDLINNARTPTEKRLVANAYERQAERLNVSAASTASKERG